MGLLEALVNIGAMVSQNLTVKNVNDSDEIKEILKYALLPPVNDFYNSIVVRIHVEVDNPYSDSKLEVKSVVKIDTDEVHRLIEEDEEDLRMKLPFIGVESATPYFTMPFFIVKGKDGYKRVLKTLKKKILEYLLVREEVISEEGKDNILRGIKEKDIENLVKEEIGKGKEVIVALGVVKDGRFLYPGEVPAFRRAAVRKIPDVLKKKDRGVGICPLCGKKKKLMFPLSKVPLKFSTLDKVGFTFMLQGEIKEGTFYICEDCFINLRRGRYYVERHLTIKKFLGNVQLWIVPEKITRDTSVEEIVFEIRDLMQHDSYSPTAAREQEIWKDFASFGESIVLHLLFMRTEQNKEEIRGIITDVPPTRLAKLGDIYKEVISSVEGDVNGTIHIGHLISDIKRFFIEDALGKDKFASSSKEKKMYLVDKAVKTYISLLERKVLSPDLVKSILMRSAINVVYSSDKNRNHWLDLKEVVKRSHRLVEMGYKLRERGGEIP